MASPAQLKEDEFRHRVLQAAAKLFQRHGLTKVTLEDIAKAVGRSKSALYYYYKSKEGIIEAVLEIEILDAERQLLQETVQATTVQERLEAFCLTKLRIFQEKPALYNVVTRNNPNGGTIYDICRRYLRSEQRVLMDILNHGSGHNAAKVVTTQDLPTVSFLLNSALQGIREEYKLYDNPMQTAHTVKLLTGIFVKGLKYLSQLPSDAS